MNVVLDSSVIAKWYFEEGAEEGILSIKLRNQHIQNQITIFAPTFLLLELGNIFLNKKIASQQFFDENVPQLLDFGIKFTEIQKTLLQKSFTLAQKYKITFYDATYVALAQTLDCQFITADKKLADITKNLKFVKLLSPISIYK